MAKREPKSGGGKRNPVAIIRGYTDSVERIGADAALLGLIAVLGFGALAIGANGPAVVVFGIAVWGAWIVTKFANAYLQVKKEQLELDKIRVERGQKILEAHPDRQKRLSLRKKNRDRDG